MEEIKTLGHNAGYDIIRAETYETDQQGCEYQIVLGFEHCSGMYVTWECNAHSDGVRDYYWGHYLDKPEAALADYHRRLLEHYTGKGGVSQF